MGIEALRILESALALSEKERAELAEKLFASLHGATDPDASEAWAAEITRRAESVVAGKAKLVDWEEADAQAARLVNGE